jgi:hypothetical protein
LSVRAVFGAAGLLLAFQGTAAACGICIEDKIATVYDHAIVTQAFGRKHHVAFFLIDGPLAPGDGTRRALEALAESAHGVDRGSARVSVDSASLSVAFDPRRAPLAAVQKALEQRLAAKKLSLMPMRVLEQPGKMKAIGQR